MSPAAMAARSAGTTSSHSSSSPFSGRGGWWPPRPPSTDDLRPPNSRNARASDGRPGFRVNFEAHRVDPGQACRRASYRDASDGCYETRCGIRWPRRSRHRRPPTTPCPCRSSRSRRLPAALPSAHRHGTRSAGRTAVFPAEGAVAASFPCAPSSSDQALVPRAERPEGLCSVRRAVS